VRSVVTETGTMYLSHAVKAKIELSPFGRIPWTRLGEALVSRNCFITGFPEEFAPKVVNDQVSGQVSFRLDQNAYFMKLTGGTAPSTWSVNRSKPILALIESGQLRIEPRPPGRCILLLSTFLLTGVQVERSCSS